MNNGRKGSPLVSKKKLAGSRSPGTSPKGSLMVEKSEIGDG